MTEDLGLVLIAVGGLISMGIITFVFVRIMINTTKYANKNQKDNK